MLKDVLVAVGVLEGNVFKFDVSLDVLPVFTLRLEHISVFCDDFGRVRYVRFGFDKVCETLDVYLNHDELRDGVDNPAYRSHDAH